jgi:hypothetical protein
MLVAAAALAACGGGLAANDSGQQEDTGTMTATATMTVTLPAVAFQAVDVTAEPVALEVIAVATGGDVRPIGPVSAPFPANPNPSPAADWPEQLTEAQMRSLLDDVGCVGGCQEAALRVAWCESRFSPGATGAAGERGLWQIHPVNGRLSTYDPVGNARSMMAMSEGGTNWWAWTCKP